MNHTSTLFYIQATLISLINVEPTLTAFEKFHPPQKQNPPSTKFFFLDYTKTVQVRA